MASNSQPGRDVEERLAFLEREANYWRVKFEELEKWRESLEDWVIANIGVPHRARTPASNNRWVKSSPNSQLSSPSNNGWSPDSSDASTSVNNNSSTPNNFQPKSLAGEDGLAARRSTYDFDSQEDNNDDTPGGLAKKKRGRPKKAQDFNPPTNNFGANSMTNSNMVPNLDGKSEGSDINHWGYAGESVNMQPAVPVKRGRGRPRKIKTDEEDDDKERKKPGRKKRDPAVLLAKACDQCGMEFESNQDLLSHKRLVHPEKFHKCTVCNETYLHSGFLARHMETHTLDRDFKCHLCVSSFNTYQLLKLHCTEKHGVEVGRQTEWKREGDVGPMAMNRPPGPMDGYLGQQQPHPPQAPAIMSPSSIPTNCAGPNNDLVRSDLMNSHSVSTHQQFIQRQQQQHAMMQQQQQQHQQHHHNHVQQIQPPHHMQRMQQQQPNQPSHPHHSQHMQQPPPHPHSLHHHPQSMHPHQQQSQQHQQHQVSHPHQPPPHHPQQQPPPHPQHQQQPTHQQHQQQPPPRQQQQPPHQQQQPPHQQQQHPPHQQQQHPQHQQPPHPQHQQPPRQQRSFNNEDDEENEIDGSGYALDFGCNGSDTLPPLFDAPVPDGAAMGNYLNSIEPDTLQMY